MTAAPAVLSPAEARTRTDQIRADLAAAVSGMRTAIGDGVPAALGYPTAWAWADAELGDLLRQLRLPRDVRLRLVDAMDTMPVRDVAERLGVSVGTIQNDKQKLGKVVLLARRRGAAPPAPAGKVYEQAAEWLRRAGADGLTLVELAERTGWTEGKSSGVLTYLLQRGRAVRLETRRAGQRVHVAAGDAA